MTDCTKTPTPNTHTFTKYLEEHVRPLLAKTYSRPQVSVMIDLLRYLEQQRFDFSADRAFQTRPISNAAIAVHFGVTERSVRRWIAALECLGIIKRITRKNPKHSYKNLLNRLGLASFAEWFASMISKIAIRTEKPNSSSKPETPDSQCPPNKKDIINISIRSKNFDEKKEPVPEFPAKGSIKYNPHWKNIAEKHLPQGRSRPCMNLIAQKFRENLKLHQKSLNDPSLTARWMNFCKKARPVA